MSKAAILLHHLRLFGLKARQRDGHVVVGDGHVSIRLCAGSTPAQQGVATRPVEGGSLEAVAGQGQAWGALRSFHPVRALSGEGLVPVVRTVDGHTLWAWRVTCTGGELVLGTDLAADLTLIRQGDPAAAANRPTEALWGFAGERPNYLFEGQIDTECPHERLADWWMWTLREALVRLGGVAAEPVLPFGAAGAIIITGDDDQAPLEDYCAQSCKLGHLPVTYFLHPLTRHDAVSMADHAKGRVVEWELHPDALETPGEYGIRLCEQVQWFAGLAGHRPKLVRNHGFLNDGYWGHAGPWLQEGIIGSSNLPGVDGRVINGSLLPSRLALDGALTSHWSLLTAFGDGVFFVYEWSAEQALEAVAAMGRRIAESGVPGIIVLNLHPANHEKAAAMHEAAHRLVADQGFAAMTLGDAISWFAARDEEGTPASTASMIAPFTATRMVSVTGVAADQGIPDGGKPPSIARRALNAITRLGRGRHAA